MDVSTKVEKKVQLDIFITVRSMKVCEVKGRLYVEKYIQKDLIIIVLLL